MRLHKICQTHGTTAWVGPGTLISELECVTCVAIADGILPALVPTDPEELFISRITRHHNGNCCCGTCEPYYCFGCDHYGNFCTCPSPVSLRKAPRYAPPSDTEPPF